MRELYESKHATTVVSIISVMLTSTNLSKWIKYPLSTMFYTLLSGGIIGRGIQLYTPKILRSYMPGSILILSILHVVAKYLGWLPLADDSPFIKIDMSSATDVTNRLHDRKEITTLTTVNTNTIMYKLYRAFQTFIHL